MAEPDRTIVSTEEPPRHKIDCKAAAFLMDASAELAILNEKFKALGHRVHRGELDSRRMRSSLLHDIRSTARKFMRALEMVEHCLEDNHK